MHTEVRPHPYRERNPEWLLIISLMVGLGVSVLRSMIINMIFFSNFEFVKKQINALEVD